MRRRGFTKWEVFTVFLVMVVGFALVIPAWRHEPKHSNCQTNLKQIALGFKQYIQDYNECYPRAVNSSLGIESSTNWAGQLQPYLKRKKVIFQCNFDDNATSPDASSYGYNARISGVNESKMNDSPLIVLNFEVLSRSDNMTQTGKEFSAVTASTRHLEGSNFSFVDGHVKWFKPEKLKESDPSRESPHFAVW